MKFGAMIPNQRKYDIFGMGQTRVYMCVLIISSPIQFLLSSQNTGTQQKIPHESGNT